MVLFYEIAQQYILSTVAQQYIFAIILENSKYFKKQITTPLFDSHFKIKLYVPL